MNPRPGSASSDMQGRLLLVFMVIAGYVLAFAIRSSQDGSLTFPVVLLGVSLGAVYLFLCLYPGAILDRFPSSRAAVLYFTVQGALLLGIGFVLGTGGSWLIGLPLAAYAVELLPPRQRWPVYAGLVAILILPTGVRHGNWTGALLDGAMGSTAVFFVAVFAQMRLNEQRARQRAEQLTAELEEANAQLAAYATQAEELAMTRERNRLAREIHDNLGHYLTIVNVQIEAAKTVMDSDPSRALDALDKAQELTQKGLARVRESVAALRESPVSDRPLSEAIETLVREAQSTGIVTEFKINGQPLALESKVALALYRTAQEALTNVRKHARASRVDVLLDYLPAHVRIEVVDNGVGAAETSGGFGLLGIRERVHLLGGGLETSTEPGCGFRLAATVPLASVDCPAQPQE